MRRSDRVLFDVGKPHRRMGAKLTGKGTGRSRGRQLDARHAPSSLPFIGRIGLALNGERVAPVWQIDSGI
jgi:hypothetical protein